MGRILAFFNQDKHLVSALRQGNAKAQRQVYDRYAPNMLSICVRYIGDRMQAEDVMIEGLTKVFSKIDQFNGEGSLEGWIRRIIVNEALGYLRKQKRGMEESLHLNAEYYADGVAADADMEAESLLSFIQELPTGYRTVFNLYAIEGYSHKEISELLDISESTSKSQLHRARQLLQKRLSILDQEMYKLTNHDKASD
ncbi:RNA polymerase sigma factor [Dyadobacter tibetensis]|uniref:RNA polymerase sigma factor n=1 Tax=Dyadobacter tibetensis TaxID=1211851 RepID=UPI00047066C8|nr:sigma-70 family RNA polymerase sigma factor [Dyadobacter tibetensis]